MKLELNIESLREYCLNKKGATEGFPFDETTLVFKVAGKMFALTDTESPLAVNLKCDPQKAIELREKYDAVKPGYHMSKKHWNTVNIDGSIPSDTVAGWIDDSYQLIVKGLTAKQRETIK